MCVCIFYNLKGVKLKCQDVVCFCRVKNNNFWGVLTCKNRYLAVDVSMAWARFCFFFCKKECNTQVLGCQNLRVCVCVFNCLASRSPQCWRRSTGRHEVPLLQAPGTEREKSFSSGHHFTEEIHCHFSRCTRVATSWFYVINLALNVKALQVSLTFCL